MNPVIGEMIMAGAGIYFATLGARRRKKESFNEKIVQQAVDSYIETGHKSKAFYSADRATIEAAERTRLGNVEKQRRQRENAAIDAGFQAVCECPKCQTLDLHWLTGNMAGRQCRKCGYTWHVPV